MFLNFFHPGQRLSLWFFTSIADREEHDHTPTTFPQQHHYWILFLSGKLRLYTRLMHSIATNLVYFFANGLTNLITSDSLFYLIHNEKTIVLRWRIWMIFYCSTSETVRRLSEYLRFNTWSEFSYHFAGEKRPGPHPLKIGQRLSFRMSLHTWFHKLLYCTKVLFFHYPKLATCCMNLSWAVDDRQFSSLNLTETRTPAHQQVIQANNKVSIRSDRDKIHFENESRSSNINTTWEFVCAAYTWIDKMEELARSYKIQRPPAAPVRWRGWRGSPWSRITAG